jgi:hypothetical protein
MAEQNLKEKGKTKNPRRKQSSTKLKQKKTKQSKEKNYIT